MKAKYRTAKTLDEWTLVASMGTYECDFRNGELWYLNGEFWYLSHLELSPEVLHEVLTFYEDPIVM